MVMKSRLSTSKPANSDQIMIIKRLQILFSKALYPCFQYLKGGIVETISSPSAFLLGVGHSWIHYSVACRDLVVEPSRLWSGLAADWPPFQVRLSSNSPNFYAAAFAAGTPSKSSLLFNKI